MIRALIILATLILVTAGLSAQDIYKDVQKPTHEETQQQRAERLASEALKRFAPGEDVTYEAILADPDNVELNYRYARAQVRRGDVKSAAATLERILLVDQNQTEVRLFYAIVLYRLDNIVEAQRELDVLQKLTLPPLLREESGKYAAAVAKRLKKTHISGLLGAGFEYDTNRNAAPASGQALFLGTPIPISDRRDDTSLILMGNVGVKRDLPYQSVPEVFGSFNYYQAEQTLAKNINLKAYSVQIGGVYRANHVKLTPSLLFDHVELAQSTFLRDRGGDLRLDYRFSPTTNLFLEGRDMYQDFVATPQVGAAAERTGVQTDFTAGTEHILNPSLKFGTVIGYGFKNAAEQYWGFDRLTAGINCAWLMGRGTFLISSINANYDKYKAEDPTILGGYRHDSTMRASGTLGAPLGVLHPKLKDLLATLTYEYYHALSTIKNYAYTNNKIAAMITYRWEVGL